MAVHAAVLLVLDVVVDDVVVLVVVVLVVEEAEVLEVPVEPIGDEVAVLAVDPVPVVPVEPVPDVDPVLLALPVGTQMLPDAQARPGEHA